MQIENTLKEMAKELGDFIEYARKHGVDIQAIKSENPDTFKKIFGEPGEDAISRQQVKSDYADWFGYGYRDNWFYRHLSNIPPVNPQEPKSIQEKQAESEKYQKAFDDGYDNGYAQARFDYEQRAKDRTMDKNRY